MKKARFLYLFCFYLFLCLVNPVCVNAGEDYIQASCAIQVSSTASEGKFSIPEIIEIAKKNNINVLMLTDRDFMNWEYGLWPLRRVFKKTEKSNSVSIYGINRYFKEIEDLQKKNENLVLIPGIESAPFYYWQGSPISNKFKLCNWHKHILIFGLDNPQDYRKLPSVSNPYKRLLPSRPKDIYSLWPLLFLTAGILCLIKREFKYKDFNGRLLSPYSRKWQITGLSLIITALLFLFNNFPFPNYAYDQYHGDQGVKPYQNLIDYVNQKGGLTFWAHPEAENIEKIGRVDIETPEHTNNLMEALDYTGFAVFHEGYKSVGKPSGLWDIILEQYCKSQRKFPVWAIGGLGFDNNGDLEKQLKDLRTILLLPNLNKQEALGALKKGRMYVVRGLDSPNFVLDEFTAFDAAGGAQKTMGELAQIRPPLIINIKGRFLNGQSKPFKIKLIKNGGIIKIFEVTSPFDISYTDENIAPGRKNYYRLEAQSQGVFLITNPIFAELK